MQKMTKSKTCKTNVLWTSHRQVKESQCKPPKCSKTEVFIKGNETIAASLPWSSTAREVRHLVAEATKVPPELLHVTVGGRALTDEVVCGIGAGATLHYSIKGLGGADVEQQGQ